MFAALNTVEPPIVERSMALILERDKSWHEERLVMLNDRVRVRLKELADRLGTAEWLDGEFSAGDLLMVTVLRMSRAAKRGPRTSAPSPHNSRFSRTRSRTAEGVSAGTMECD